MKEYTRVTMVSAGVITDGVGGKGAHKLAYLSACMTELGEGPTRSI